MLQNPVAAHTTATFARVRIVSPERLLHDCLASRLSEESDFETTSASETIDAALAQLSHQPQEIILLGLECLRALGGECAAGAELAWRRAAELKSVTPGIKVVALDDRPRAFRYVQSQRFGLSGYVTKQDCFHDIAGVLRLLHRGHEGFLSPHAIATTSLLIGPSAVAASTTKCMKWLSPRELQVLSAFVQGKSTKECSQEMCISPNTIENHKANIMRKLNVRRAVDLFRIAVAEGLLSA